MEAATQIQHSAVDNALVVNDTGPLEELVDSCLDQESKAGRTSVKFAINRMLKAKSRYKAKELIAVSHEFPHAADSLAHLFAQVFTPESLEGWFLEGTGSDWWIFDWSTSHYLRIFPSNYEPGSRLIEWVSDKVASGSSNVPLLAVCAQRLASWNPEKYRSAMRAGMERSNNPHVRRILALCALVATEPRRNVSRWLGQEEENRITLDMLEDSSFVAPKVNAGYARAT